MTHVESLRHANPTEGFMLIYQYNSVSSCRGILEKYQTKYNFTMLTVRKLCELSNSLNLTLWWNTAWIEFQINNIYMKKAPYHQFWWNCFLPQAYSATDWRVITQRVHDTSLRNEQKIYPPSQHCALYTFNWSSNGISKVIT